MNKRDKRITSYFILFSLMLILGVVFAILQANLQINGTAKIANNSWDIHFDNIVVNQDSVPIGTGNTAATIDPNNDCKVDFSVTLSLPGDFYEFTVDVVNTGTIDAMISTLEKSLKVNNVETEQIPEYLIYTVTYSDGDEILENHLLASGDTETYKVLIKYNDDIENVAEPATLSMSVEPVYVQADSGAINRPVAMFIDGKRFNARIKQLSGTSDATYSTSNTNITAFRKSSNPPDMNSMTNDNIVSISPDKPIYAWFDNGTIYYYSESNKMYFNPNSSYMFYYFRDISVIELDDIDVSNVTDMSSMFYNFGTDLTSFSLDLSNWDTSNVTDMSYMFVSAGCNATTYFLNLSNLNTSNVTTMYEMFEQAGLFATTFSLNLSNWDLSKVTNMSYMFAAAGMKAETFTIDFSSWDTSNVEYMSGMFREAAKLATNFYLDLSNWDTSNVTDMTEMFAAAGHSATNFYLDVSTWNVSKANLSYMFQSTAYNASNFFLDVSNWDTSKTKNMYMLFQGTGYYVPTFNIDVSNWDVSQVTNMEKLFDSSGRNSTSWSIGNLSNWNPLSATNMTSMFNEAGYGATTWNSIGTLKVYAKNFSTIFLNCQKAKATLKIYSNPTSYSGAFMFAATASGSGITVDYTSSVNNIDSIIAMKSSNSNVVKGSLFTP